MVVAITPLRMKIFLIWMNKSYKILKIFCGHLIYTIRQFIKHEKPYFCISTHRSACEQPQHVLQYPTFLNILLPMLSLKWVRSNHSSHHINKRWNIPGRNSKCIQCQKFRIISVDCVHPLPSQNCGPGAPNVVQKFWVSR